MGIQAQYVGAAAASEATASNEKYRAAERSWWKHHGLEPTERFADIGSPRARLRVLEVGSGPPVLFVHGTAGSGSVWAPLVRELEGFRCVLLDRPGWALSSPVDYSREDYKLLTSKVLLGVLDALGIDRAQVVGGSIGNLWGLRLAQAHPDRVDRIVLMGGGPLFPDIEVPKIVRLLASPLGALMVRLPEKRTRALAIVRGNGHGPSLDAGRMDEFIDWRVALGRTTNSMQHERDMVRSIVHWRKGLFRPGVRLEDSELREIRHKILFMYGSSDPVGSTGVWRRFVELLPNARLQVYEGGGHMPWLDDPAHVGAIARGFLGSAPQSERLP